MHRTMCMTDGCLVCLECGCFRSQTSTRSARPCIKRAWPPRNESPSFLRMQDLMGLLHRLGQARTAVQETKHAKAALVGPVSARCRIPITPLEFMYGMWLSFFPLICNKTTRSYRNFLKNKRSCQKKGPFKLRRHDTILPVTRPAPTLRPHPHLKPKLIHPPRAHHTTTSCDLSRQPGNICFQIFLNYS
jgi:hypothetical protein